MGRIDGSVGQRDYAYEFYIIWEETDINVANNTSKIIATSYIYCKQHSAYNNNTYTHTITIDGQTFTTSVAGVSLSPGVVKQLASASKVITHDDDGSKWINISADSPTLPSGNGYGPANGSASEDVGLYTIPRASSVTCADGNIGSSTVININRASSSFKHTLEYSFNGLTGTIATKTDNTSIGWNIPTSFYAKIPNALSGSGTITCKTYNGDTLIGTSTCTFNAFVVNSNPTVTATVVDTNSKTIALTGDSNKIVKYYSNARVDITATPKNSASITERRVIAGNKSGTGTSVTLNSVETNVFNVSCKDSRGLTASTQITKTLVNYVKLAITNISLERPEQTSNTINISLNGNYFNNTFGSVANTLELKFRYKQDGGSFGSYTTLTATKNGNTFSCNAELGTNFDYQKQYVFEVVASDKLMTVTYRRTVTKGIPQIDRGKNDIKYNTNIYINNRLSKNYIGWLNNAGTKSFNDAITRGLYDVNGSEATDGPGGYGVLDVDVANGDTWNNNNNWIWQTFYSTDGRIYQRNAVNSGAFSGWRSVLTRESLYDNSSGTTGTVTLSENAADYDYLEIYYTNNGQQRSMKVASPNGKVVMLDNWIYEESTTYLFTRINKITISGTIITRNLTRGCAVNGAEATFTNEYSTFAITKVVGYK